MALFYKTFKVSDLLDIDEGRMDRSRDLICRLDNVYNILREDTFFEKLKNLFRSKKPKMFYKVFKYHIISNSGQSYTVFIKVAPSFNIKNFMDNKIEVFCQCADFKYRVAYMLNQRDNLFRNPNIDAHLGIALTTKPTQVETSHLCKHVYRALMEFRLNINNLIIK